MYRVTMISITVLTSFQEIQHKNVSYAQILHKKSFLENFLFFIYSYPGTFHISKSL